MPIHIKGKIRNSNIDKNYSSTWDIIELEGPLRGEVKIIFSDKAEKDILSHISPSEQQRTMHLNGHMIEIIVH